MYFDLSVLSPQTVINQATLSFFQSDSQREPGGFIVSKVTSSWSEDIITWSNAPSVGGTLFQTGTLPSGSVGQYSNINLTNLIQDWVKDSSQNFGLFFSLVDSAGGDTISSKDHPSNTVPSLLLDITEPQSVPEPSSILLLGSACLMFVLRRKIAK